jgi:prepilin-type N-terminal cleavage/methylation domain-containing protein
MIRRRGFTLIELMIVIAVTVILIAAVFAVNFRITGLWASERGRSELQQNFRFATDYMSTWTRQANSIIQPELNVMSDVLQFDSIDANDPTRCVRRTYRRSGIGPYCISESVQDLVKSGGHWDPSGDEVERPITESIRSLAAVHFVRTGPRVIIILVAEYSLLGSVQTISYTTQTYVRTLEDPEG